jgi:transcriptional regulator with PAS, ATPase and Fis domain
LESELFGYVPGAFTGASAKGKPGLFELADTGTLFLDEIGELPVNLQSALLRVLQDGEVTRVGAAKSKKVDVRILTATNRNLEQMIKDGTFRSDLYYRLNVVSVFIPPLRERRADIPFLAEKTIHDLNKKYSTEKTLSPDFMQFLKEQDWPGNIRELKNYIEKQYVLSDSNIIENLVFSHQPSAYSTRVSTPQDVNTPSEPKPLPTYADAKIEMETELFTRAMEQGGSTYKAASLLGMSQSTFFRKYKEIFPDA